MDDYGIAKAKLIAEALGVVLSEDDESKLVDLIDKIYEDGFRDGQCPL